MSGMKVLLLSQQDLELIASCLEACMHPNPDGSLDMEDVCTKMVLDTIKEVRDQE
jgi:hypothetical protein